MPWSWCVLSLLIGHLRFIEQSMWCKPGPLHGLVPCTEICARGSWYESYITVTCQQLLQSWISMQLQLDVTATSSNFVTGEHE